MWGVRGVRVRGRLATAWRCGAVVSGRSLHWAAASLHQHIRCTRINDVLLCEWTSHAPQTAPAPTSDSPTLVSSVLNVSSIFTTSVLSVTSYPCFISANGLDNQSVTLDALLSRLKLCSQAQFIEPSYCSCPSLSPTLLYIRSSIYIHWILDHYFGSVIWYNYTPKNNVKYFIQLHPAILWLYCSLCGREYIVSLTMYQPSQKMLC